jgi:hypothetical protein
VPAEDEEEVVRVFVLVPDEFAFDLDDAQIVVVEAANDLRLPVRPPADQGEADG